MTSIRPPMPFADLLTAHLEDAKSRGLFTSENDFAKACGWDNSGSLSNIRRNGTPPPWPKVVKMAEKLGLLPDEREKFYREAVLACLVDDARIYLAQHFAEFDRLGKNYERLAAEVQRLKSSKSR